ncbi:MAG TPA: sugar phosphate isomerase/epimerase [Candidatus Hydrogenedentes bacterium]|nr:sugar phosphate isomerase/epimerase [Candidatus Hydrogenedentota bacterium]
MKLGCLTAMFSDKSLDQVLDIVRPFGLQALELGAGNYPGAAHLDVQGLLSSKPKRDELLGKLKGEGLEISAISCHGNCLHPDSAFAKENIKVQNNAIKLAEKLGVKVVIDFSGCPGESDKAAKPNWVTCPWPPDYIEILEWQWDKKVIPYWKKQAKFAADHGVKVAFEMHPGFVVYNTETMLKLRKECGNNLGGNFDPSHLFWQGMDPIASVRALGKAIFHVHAKDSKVDEFNTAVNGVLDTKHYGDEINRSWIFRTVGYGHGREWWNDFVSTLRLVGYDGVLSIEHEDSLMSSMEGLGKAVALLKDVLLFEKVTAMTWA